LRSPLPLALPKRDLWERQETWQRIARTPLRMLRTASWRAQEELYTR